jgi:hypothetical protein
MKCLNCETELVKWQKKFCSKSCAAVYNNKKYPKRVRDPKKICVDCKEAHVWRVGARCSSCSQIHTKKRQAEKTLEDHKKYSGRPYDKIRREARQLMNDLEIEKKCSICGYDFYVELCHIKPIASFDLQTKIGEINDPTNLVYLCPNHHKELDAGIV